MNCLIGLACHLGLSVVVSVFHRKKLRRLHLAFTIIMKLPMFPFFHQAAAFHGISGKAPEEGKELQAIYGNGQDEAVGGNQKLYAKERAPAPPAAACRC